MHGVRMILWRGLAVSLAFVAAPSCRKPEEAVKSDLKEAGYQLTNEDWMRAASGNDVSALKKFVKGGFPPDTRDAAGDSALHAAAGSGSQEAADYLMNRGLSVDLPGAKGRTPLMAAIAGDRTAMVKWFLKQGADPRAKDAEDFSPLMLAVREGRSGSVAELAPYHREMLDPAILLASLVGQTDVIDTLTNYGASVYARMEDGRTPLMIAAENGHKESVELLLDIGASRLATDNEGHSAADLATAAGNEEIAGLISRDPLPDELALETPEEIAQSMDEFVDTAITESAEETQLADNDAAPVDPGSAADSTAVATGQTHAPSRPIQGEVLSNAVAQETSAVTGKPRCVKFGSTCGRNPCRRRSSGGGNRRAGCVSAADHAPLPRTGGSRPSDIGHRRNRDAGHPGELDTRRHGPAGPGASRFPPGGGPGPKTHGGQQAHPGRRGGGFRGGGARHGHRRDPRVDFRRAFQRP